MMLKKQRDEHNLEIKQSNLPQIPEVEWQRIDWKKVEKTVFNLQKRIYQATIKGDEKRAQNLIKLLLRSHSNVLLNIRRVTQDNSGKKTAGIDGIKSLSPTERLQLAEEITQFVKSNWENYKAKPIRRVYIPKANGKKRPLGIPTLRDRVIQGMVKTAIEPQWEAIFEPTSYGFRPAYSTHDAIQLIFNNIRLKQKWVLDADITLTTLAMISCSTN